MARRLWPGEEPIGRRIRFGEADSPAATVVGVVGDVKHMGLDADEGPAFYQPLAQKRYDWLRWMTIVVRAQAGPLDLVPAVRGSLRELDRNLPLDKVATL